MHDPKRGEHPNHRWRSPGMWLGIACNVAAFAAGAVFFTAPNGARFRGMEPEAAFFISVSFAATLVGLFFGLLLSTNDLIDRRWCGGAIGIVLALTPFFVAQTVSELARILLNLTWD